MRRMIMLIVTVSIALCALSVAFAQGSPVNDIIYPLIRNDFDVVYPGVTEDDKQLIHVAHNSLYYDPIVDSNVRGIGLQYDDINNMMLLLEYGTDHDQIELVYHQDLNLSEILSDMHQCPVTKVDAVLIACEEYEITLADPRYDAKRVNYISYWGEDLLRFDSQRMSINYIASFDSDIGSPYWVIALYNPKNDFGDDKPQYAWFSIGINAWTGKITYIETSNFLKTDSYLFMP